MNSSKQLNKNQFENYESTLTESRLDRINEVLKYRTKHLALVLEDIYQAQNASACLRTAECLGVLDVYFAENWNKYSLNPDVVLGSSKWLNIQRFNSSLKFNHELIQNFREERKKTSSRKKFNPKEQELSFQSTKDCFKKLKDSGYQIIATTLNEDSISLEDLDISQKSALVFGCEEFGISDYAMENSDIHLKIPMFGFTQSYNVSVSAAICFSYLIRKLHNSDIDWQLSPKELEKLRFDWYEKSSKFKAK